MFLYDIQSYLFSLCSCFIYKSRCRANALYIDSDQSYLYRLCLILYFHYNIKTILFVDISASDFPQNRARFFLSYNLYSISYNIRILFSFLINNNHVLNSIINIFPSANWYEREIWDLFGITFIGHFDLRRILTDYGFSGHPLKKDYPLTGFVEVHYDENYKCIMHNNVNLIQDFRYWFFESQ
jgi:NADH:ubiquinone oxidoreductase subunit C